MNDYKELISSLKVKAKLEAYYAHTTEENTLEYKAADTIEQLVKERDAAVADLREYCDELCYCEICEHSKKCTSQSCMCSKWEWRGVQ